MFRRTKVCSGVLVALGGALGLGSAPVFGQQPQTFERVEITGSSIRRIDAESALPVRSSRRRTSQRTGATSVVDLLQKLPTVQGSHRRVGVGRRRLLRLLGRLDPQHRRDPHPGAAERSPAEPVRRPDAHRLRRRDRPERDPDLGDRARRDPDRRRIRPVRRRRHRRRGQLHHQAQHRPKATSRVGYLLSAGRRRRREALQRLEGLRHAREGRLQRLAVVRHDERTKLEATDRDYGKHRPRLLQPQRQELPLPAVLGEPDSGQRDRRPRPV